MVSPPTIRPLAPSPNLLRFLRSQFNQTCSASYPRSWTSSNANNCPIPAPLGPPRYLATSNSRFKLSSRQYSTSLVQIGPTSRRRASLKHELCQNNGTLLGSHNHCRSFSLTTKKGRHFLRRLLGFSRSNVDSQLKPDDLPPTAPGIDDGNEGNPFNIGRNLALKVSNEPRLRCTEFDEIGNVTLVNGEFKKSELIAKYGLLPRDLRKIDSSVLPHILIRPSAILISLLHLRVLIKSNRVLVFDAYGSTDTYTQSLFMYDLEGKLRQKEPASRQLGTLPYELRALEAVLVSITSGLEAEFEGVREPVVGVLRALEEDIDRDKLRHLLIYSKRLGTFEQKARLVRDAIEDLLEADDDLTAMYLTEREKGICREEHDHQEVEMLLESYHKICDEIVQASGNLVTSIRNTEEIVKAILDANRNSLMLLELKFSIGTLGLAAGTLFSALYGMNLKNFIEESDLGFAAVSATCFTFTAVVCAYGLIKLRKVQRVRMWGEGGRQDTYMGGLGLRGCSPAAPRNNWRADTIGALLPGEARAQRLRRLRAAPAPPAPPSPSLDEVVAGGPNPPTRSKPTSSPGSATDLDTSKLDHQQPPTHTPPSNRESPLETFADDTTLGPAR
ncbi:magnesium ion transporter [Myotisia sp. PD_48]|nr:magnesium ion transporter [Myotisia sp. PD_48]